MHYREAEKVEDLARWAFALDEDAQEDKLAFSSTTRLQKFSALIGAIFPKIKKRNP